MRLKGLDFLKTWRGKKGAGEGHLEEPTPVLLWEAMGLGGEIKEVVL